MKELILNDGRRTQIQSAVVTEDNLLIRLILTTSEELKALFKDEFATSTMILKENNKEITRFENYTRLDYIKEETGGIWEVSFSQTEASTNDRLKIVEEGLQENVANLEKAVAELTLLISTMSVRG